MRSPRQLNHRVVQLTALSWLIAGTAQAAEVPCANLKSLIFPADAIALPSRGAKVQSADVVDRSAASTVSAPEYCRIVGTIAPIDPSAPLITFQVNLPTSWNGKALQYGGGGFNGTLITGVAPAPDAPPGAPTPLAMGYVTFGTDSGHQAAALAEPQAFALNAEALENFAYGSYKKVRDVAVEIIVKRYGRRPTRTYYMGTSEGGREGLTMAQRFPADYDGIISRVPVINWTGLQHAGHRSGLMQQSGGWLNPAKVIMVSVSVLKACDALDGLSDGIVSNYHACGGAFHVESLRCSTGADEGDSCLSDRQVRAIETLHVPFEFTFPLANGVAAYPGFGYGGEAQAGGFPQWVTAASAAAFPSPTNSNGSSAMVLSGTSCWGVDKPTHSPTR